MAETIQGIVQTFLDGLGLARAAPPAVVEKIASSPAMPVSTIAQVEGWNATAEEARALAEVVKAAIDHDPVKMHVCYGMLVAANIHQSNYVMPFQGKMLRIPGWYRERWVVVVEAAKALHGYQPHDPANIERERAIRLEFQPFIDAALASRQEAE